MTFLGHCENNANKHSTKTPDLYHTCLTFNRGHRHWEQNDVLHKYIVLCGQQTPTPPGPPYMCCLKLFPVSKYISYVQMPPPYTHTLNMHIFHLSFNCSLCQFQSPALKNKLSSQPTATLLLWGPLCVMTADNTIRYKSILAPVLSLKGRGCIFGALTKVWHVWFFLFTSASSASHSFCLVLISVSWRDEGKKQRTAATLRQQHKQTF